MDKRKNNKDVTDNVLIRLRRMGVDVTDLYEIIAALESEIEHYREVVKVMQAKLRIQPRRVRGYTYYDYVHCDPFNLTAHIQEINESGCRIVSTTQDSDGNFTILIEMPCDG